MNQAWRVIGGVIGVALLAHLCLWVAVPLWAATLAGLMVTAWLPGLVLALLVLGAPRDEFEWLELPLFAVGAGFGLQIVGMTLLSYLSGGITPAQVLLAFDGLTLLLLALLWWSLRRPPAIAPVRTSPAGGRRLWWAVIVVLVVSAGLRLTDIGYAEFHRDEARTVILMAQASEGFHNALMAHYKGPAEMVIPGAPWLLAGRIDEATGRLPFAIANLCGVLAILTLGWRLWGSVAGVSAALLMALNGYMIAFSRFLQYQSIVFLESVLVILLLWLVLQDVRGGGRRDLVARLTLGAFLFAASLLAHYDAAAILAPAIFLLWQLHGAGLSWGRLLRTLTIPALVGGALVALFYVPFALYPGFAAAYLYTVDYRIGGSFPYNNLVDFFTRASLYNGSYYLLFLTGVTAAYLVQTVTRRLSRVAAWSVGVAVFGALALAFLRPEMLQFADHDWMWLLFAAPLAATWFAPGVSNAERMSWLWFGSMLIFSLFVVALPRTHVYVFFIPWALVVGAALGIWSKWLHRRFSTRVIAVTGSVAAVLFVGVFGYYVYQVLVRTDVEVLRTWRENRPAGYWHPFDEPTDVGIYAFPLRNGWKAIGAAYARGELQGMFRTNEMPDVVEWYTAGMGVCPRDDRYYIVTETVETTDDAFQAALRTEVEQDYNLAANVIVNNLPRLALYARDAGPAPAVWPDAAAAATFDAELASPQRAGYRGRVLTATPQQPVDFRLGDNQVQLLGYTLDRASVAPGEEFEVTIYWQALSPLYSSYTVFTQLIDPATDGKVGQRDGLPVCDRYPTDQWNAGDIIADPYRITVAADAQAGDYTLLVGMYDAATGQRLPVSTPDGQPQGDAVPLAVIPVR